MKRYVPLMFMTSLAICYQQLHAQEASHYDSSYYARYPGSFTARVYYVQKYSGLEFPSNNSTGFQYKVNSNQGIGVGFTYKYISLNIAFGVLNNNDDKGKSKGFGLQLHAYPHKWTFDLVTGFNTGCYIDPQGFAASHSNSYYYRPDVKFDFAGLALYRVQNGDRFSYHAAMTQNEWQKKSAGSLLYGGQAYYTKLQGDSNLVPHEVAASFSQSDADKISVFGFGPGVGYAYTLVAAKRFFFLGSLVANLDINFTSESGTHSVNKVTVNPGMVYKAAIGYNGASWNISGNWTGLSISFPSASAEENFKLPAGNFKFIIAKRFRTGKHAEVTPAP